ncbi:hypothetical protein EDB83DRAFT_2524753 [Lactarius deliciosus]|nr:hypothetical protein EDB83DRAFT_2524753 [Lactarius deliciosus]
MGAGFLLSLATLLLSFLFSHTQNPLEVKINHFENLPTKLYFFDATYVAYHDPIRRDLYVSSDEGKNWQRVADIPQGKTSLFIEHPFNNRMVSISSTYRPSSLPKERHTTGQKIAVNPGARSRCPYPHLTLHALYRLLQIRLYHLSGTKCEREGGWSSMCYDEMYYTKEAFSDDPKLLLPETSQCSFVHSSKDFKHRPHADLIYCVGFDTTSSTGYHSLSSSRLFSSTDFFTSEKRIEDLGINRGARGVVAFTVVSRYAVVALKDLSGETNSEILPYVTVDTRTWAQAPFPHASSARLRENAYSILENTTHSLAVDVMLNDSGAVGTLFVGDSNGTYFVESLKDTNRNDVGFTDHETLYGVDGVGLANIVANPQDVEGRDVPKELKTLITFDDGSSWSPLRLPSEDSEGHRISCNPSDADSCSLHLLSVTIPHNFGRIFSSPAPGFVMGAGSIGGALRPY